MLLAAFMQLVPNRTPPERLIYSMEAQDIAPGEQPPLSGSGRRKYIGLAVGVVLISVAALIFGWYAGEPGKRFGVGNLIKARTYSLATARGSSEIPAPIVIQLSTDMIRVSAIALGHPRLAVINGKTVTEGEEVMLQAPKSSVSLTLRVVKIGDGWIDLSDGKKMFSARLTIPSPPQPKAP
jgi:hypothetical protein